ncbi:MAG TPA: hypothetical protein VFW03_08090 [Gemmatimonadaceae bacterium]|nr:hypothetical protein [Gemmatimonadaceae bacterium]
MTRAHLLAAVAVVIAGGCSESSVGPDDSVGIKGGVPPALESIRGTVVTDAAALPVQVYLQLGADERVKVVGSDAHQLVRLDGALVELHGRWAGQALPVFVDEPVSAPFALANFVVLAVGGREAMDGVLGEDQGRYYLRLTAGDAYWFADAPSEFDAHIGQRIWVTGWRDRPPMTYGVIE